LEYKLNNTEELKNLKEEYENLETERSKEGIYQQIGKKYKSNKKVDFVDNIDKRANTGIQLKRPMLRRIIDLIVKVIQTTKSIIVLSVDRSIKIPFLFGINLAQKIKHTIFDIPVNIVYKSTDLLIISPVKHVLNRLHLYKKNNK
jgi:hypothetical protein